MVFQTEYNVEGQMVERSLLIWSVTVNLGQWRLKQIHFSNCNVLFRILDIWYIY